MALTVEHLCQSYGKHSVLQDFSFQLPEGAFLALLGTNGTGKTTLLKAIGMISPPKAGRCLWKQSDLSALSSSQRARRVAYLPQSTYAPFPMKVIDAVLLGRSPYTSFVPRSEDRQEAVRILEELGLSPMAFRDISQLSGGERQQVLLARTLAQNPQLLLLDEPTSSLDLKNQLQTMELIRRLCRQKGLTAVAAIHDINLAAMFCDRFLMLRKTSLFAYGGEEVLTPENIRAVYGVNVQVAALKDRHFILPLLPESDEKSF